MTDHFVDDEAQKLFRKFRIEIGAARKRSQPFDLRLFARAVSRRQTMGRLVTPDSLRDLEPLRQHEDKRGINIINAFAIAFQHVRHGFSHLYLPPAWCFGDACRGVCAKVQEQRLAFTNDGSI